jgi:hypothetical protein
MAHPVQVCCIDNSVVICCAVCQSMDIFFIYSRSLGGRPRLPAEVWLNTYLTAEEFKFLLNVCVCAENMILLRTQSIFIVHVCIPPPLLQRIRFICLACRQKHVCWWPQASSCLFHCIFPRYLVCWLPVFRWRTLYCAWVWRGLRGVYATVDSQFCHYTPCLTFAS